MRVTLRHPFIRQTTYAALPSGEEQIQDICRIFNLENTAQTAVIVDEIHDNPDANVLLRNKEFKLDELNYLMKRMDGFEGLESEVFYGVASAQKLSTGKDLINLTFNTHCYSVLSSFENLNQQGKRMHLNEQEWVREEELRTFDGQKYIEDMIAANPSPQLSVYGFVYPNSNQPTEVYNGKTFPHYAYRASPITVVLSQGDASELVELPTPQSAIDKALERMAISDGEIAVSVINFDMPDKIAQIGLQRTSLDDLNAFAQKMQEVGKGDHEYLSNLVAFTGITKPEELDTLMASMYEFELYPNIRNHLDYGVHMICESGHFQYDDNLEEYMDFEGYGRDRASRECGVFSPKGYLVYHGYNQQMEHLLQEKLGLSMKESEPMTELKLYMPLKVISWQQEDDWGHYETSDYEEELDSSELIGYEDDIRRELELNSTPKEVERGLMAYYGKADSVNAKVQKYVFDVEEHRGELFGVAVLTLHAPLNEEELKRIKDEITGQASDGLGESLEQREIRIDGRAVNVSLWSSGNDWSLQTAEEMGFESPNFNMTMGGMA
ncbi:antirestriction protein ArdA [Bengtsoniella intestinalis]|uniref:antirestriction protein ArdA n=1 Tax=Bengtsoniella intestinalis TaxID=3073143 RepID=UPI00391F768F